jgi:hypothetical protein
MAHYLLSCSHNCLLDDLDDAELDDLIANPDTASGYAWCQSCTTWQPVVELVATAEDSDPSESASDCAELPDGTDIAVRPAVHAQQ